MSAFRGAVIILTVKLALADLYIIEQRMFGFGGAVQVLFYVRACDVFIADRILIHL